LLCYGPVWGKSALRAGFRQTMEILPSNEISSGKQVEKEKGKAINRAGRDKSGPYEIA